MQRQEATSLAVNLMREHNLIGWRFKLNTNKRRLGVCKYTSRTIELSIYHVDRGSEDEVKDTILHEIAHALSPVRGHGPVWQKICQEIGAKPKRLGPAMNAPHKLEYFCPNCFCVVKRHRKMKRGAACGKCCKQHNGDNYDSRFVFCLKIGENLMSVANHVR